MANKDHNIPKFITNEFKDIIIDDKEHVRAIFDCENGIMIINGNKIPKGIVTCGKFDL